MSARPRFAYAQARLQARYAALPVEADWRRLSGARSLSGWLEEARGGALRDWVEGFSAHSDAHDIERGLRATLADAIGGVAALLPEPWRPAVDWCRWLALLELLRAARDGVPAPGWMRWDPRLAPLLDGDGGLDPGALQSAGAERLLGADAPLLVWQTEWRRRWPRGPAAQLEALDALVRRLAAHERAFREAAPDDAWTLRQQLRERLCLEFHRHLQQPATAFIYLALVALDLERLRRALLDRLLFEPPAAEKAPDGGPDAALRAGPPAREVA